MKNLESLGLDQAGVKRGSAAWDAGQLVWRDQCQGCVCDRGRDSHIRFYTFGKRAGTASRSANRISIFAAGEERADFSERHLQRP
ncbi:MAG: hypothetical protein MZV64_15415 [Ignavibacteriales bacterium]|nr:hypothetical protein [Ignavibacteriales bacterium]